MSLRAFGAIDWPAGNEGADATAKQPIIERVFEQSRIRRGRRAAAPVFKVTTPTGARWRFGRRKDAQAFIDRGCSCPAHHHIACISCGGSEEPT